MLEGSEPTMPPAAPPLGRLFETSPATATSHLQHRHSRCKRSIWLFGKVLASSEIDSTDAARSKALTERPKDTNATHQPLYYTGKISAFPPGSGDVTPEDGLLSHLRLFGPMALAKFIEMSTDVMCELDEMMGRLMSQGISPETMCANPLSPCCCATV